jgi:hypothetical protein
MVLLLLFIIWRKKQFYWGNCLGCLNGCYMPLVAFYNSYTPTHANSSCQPLNKPLYWTYFVIYEILIKYLLYGRIYRFLFLYFSVLCPKIIGQKWNVNLFCNSSLYTHIPNIKSISPSIAKKVVTTKYLAKFQSPRAITRPKNNWIGTKRKLVWNLAKYLVVTTLSHYDLRYWLDFWYRMREYDHKLQINFEIHSGWIIFAQLTAVGLWNFAKYLVVTTFFHYDYGMTDMGNTICPGQLVIVAA